MNQHTLTLGMALFAMSLCLGCTNEKKQSDKPAPMIASIPIKQETPKEVIEVKERPVSSPKAEPVKGQKKKTKQKRPVVKKKKDVYKGTATYYHEKFEGRPTASGEIYDRNLMTAAIRINEVPLKMGTIVEVYSVKRKKKVRVKVNDKMNPGTSAIIDLSFRAAHEIGLIVDGRTKVEVRVVDSMETL